MEELINLNWALIAPIAVIQLILLVVALVDCIRNENLKDKKVIWILIIIFANIIGPILYFIIGRRND